MGGDWLRSGALSDQQVIHFVNDELVPVWLNVRTTPVPELPALQPVLAGVELDANRMVADRHRGFFVRSAVLSSDTKTLLNPEPTDAPMRMLFSAGHFPYARVKAKDYLAMLEASTRASR